MTGKDLFGVVVRTFGLGFIAMGVIALGWVLAMDPRFSDRTSGMTSLVMMPLGLGIFLVMVADPIVNLAYRKTFEERVEIEKDRLFVEAQRIRANEQDH